MTCPVSIHISGIEHKNCVCGLVDKTILFVFCIFSFAHHSVAR